MITWEEYSRALEIVEAYDLQQIIDKENFEAGNFRLTDILPTRARNAIVHYNNDTWKYNDIELIYILDVVKLIKATGDIKILLRFKNLGILSYKIIMSHVQPFL